MDKYSFQNCLKIIVFSKDKSKVLLCRRKGEADYDGVFSFIGGKMEVSDKTIAESLKREKNEEVGEEFIIRICPKYCINILFTKNDGSKMVVSNYYSEHVCGEIKLSQEYSEYKWADINNLDSFEPKIPTIPTTIREMLRLSKIIQNQEFINI